MASLFNSKHNKYVSIPDWFKDTDLNVEQTVEHKTTYVGGGGSVVSTTSGLSNLILYNKFVVEDTELGKEALTVIDTVLNATESETTKIGETVSLSGWNTTDYISVASNSIMIVTSYIDSELNKLYGILFYDNTRSVIGSHLLTSSPEEVNVPANSYYFRISAQIVDSFKVSYKVPKEYDTEQLAQSNNNVTDYLSLDTTIPEGLNETVVADSALKLLVQSPLTLTRDLNNVIKLSMKQNNETNTNDMFVWDKKLAAFGFDITLGQAYSYIDGQQQFDSDGNPIMTNNPDFWLYDENLTDKWIIKSTRPRLSLLDNLFEYDSEKNCFILHSNLVITGGIVTYANTEDINIDDIYDGLPIDNQTLYWKEIEEEVGTDEEGNPIYKTAKVLKAKGGDGNGSGGSTAVDLTIKYDGAGNAITKLKYEDGVLTATKGSTFATDERVTTLEQEVKLYSGAINTHTLAISEIKESIAEIEGDYATKNFVTDEIAQKINGVAYQSWVEDNFVNFNDYQTISAIKNFKQGIEVNGQLLKYSDANECWVMEGDLLVTGGITSFASSSGFTPSTIMDAIVCDEQTITVDVINGIKTLKVIGGGSSNTQEMYSLTIQNSAGVAQVTYNPSSQAKTLTLTKSMVGLGSVEDIALSKWSGSSSITTVGIITSGTWNGKKIANNYLVSDTITIAGQPVSLGGTIQAKTLQTSLDIVTLSDAQEIKGKKNFTDGGLFVNGQQLVYNNDGYWKMEGNLLVTGGITAYSTDGQATPFLINADTLEGITSDSTTQVYTANAITVLKNQLVETDGDVTDAVNAISTLKDSLTSLSAVSVSKLVEALNNIGKSL